MSACLNPVAELEQRYSVLSLTKKGLITVYKMQKVPGSGNFSLMMSTVI